MARVLALTNDLLFGSRIQGDLGAAGHEVELVAAPALVAGRLGGEAGQAGAGGQAGEGKPDVLIVDLTDPDLDGPGLVEGLFQKGGLLAQVRTRARTLGFYAHIDTAVRDRAERAGFDLVVPRSRVAREGAELVRRLAVDVER